MSGSHTIICRRMDGVSMLRSGVPMIPLYIGGKPRLFRRLDVRVGDPIAMDDLRERGVNRDTCEELLARITETYRALTAHPEA